MMERIRHELREIELVTLYFLAFFLFFLTTKKLLLEQYHVGTTVLGQALIGALVVAKVVVLLGKTSWGNRFEASTAIAHVVWRTLAYTAMVFVVTLAEHLFDGYREQGTLEAAASRLWAGKNLDHFLAVNLCVAFSLLLYNIFAEVERHLGEGELQKLFLSRRKAAG